VLQRKLTSWTFIFVADGGSTDGSKQVLQKNAQQLKYVSESDKGQTNAINKGIAQMNRWLKEKKLQPQTSYLCLS